MESYRAFEALAVVVVVEGLHPAITSLNREATAHTLGCEQIIPICWKEGIILIYSPWEETIISISLYFFSAFITDMFKETPVHHLAMH